MLLVKRIYEYYRKFEYATEIKGASFRNTGQILELAGTDLLTTSPSLLEELRNSTDPIEAKLTPQKAEAADLERVSFDEKSFRFEMNEDPMATEKNGGSHSQIYRGHEKTPGDRRIQILAQDRLIEV